MTSLQYSIRISKKNERKNLEVYVFEIKNLLVIIVLKIIPAIDEYLSNNSYHKRK